MRCPYDAGLTRTEVVGPISLDRCDACGGVWLDRHELHQLARYLGYSKDAVFEEWSHIPLGSLSARSRPPVRCPYGHGQMARNPYAGNTAILVDRCDTCEGVWLDGFEIRELAAMLAPHEAHDALVKAFAMHAREQQQESREQQGFLQALSLAASSPGAALLFVVVYLVRPCILALIDIYDGADTADRTRMRRDV